MYICIVLLSIKLECRGQDSNLHRCGHTKYAAETVRESERGMITHDKPAGSQASRPLQTR